MVSTTTTTTRGPPWGVEASTPAEGMQDVEAMPESEAAATTTGEDSLEEAGAGHGAAGSVILQTYRRPSRIQSEF